MAEPLGSKLNPFTKDPQAVLDFAVDWTSWLAAHDPDDTIAVSVWAFVAGTDGLLVDTSPVQRTNTATRAVIWLKDGTPGTRYALTNRITTAGGRTDEWTIYVKVLER